MPVILLFAFTVQVIVIFSFSGTRDSGDSIQHYLIAHYAFKHPELFLDHWGKPLFTLIASIPAIFGFAGIKFFNCLMVLWSLRNVYLISGQLFHKNSWIPLLLLAFMPELMRLQFSGLTEPLFAAWLSASVLLVLRGKIYQGFVMVSFLPFIRTEGFLLLPVFAIYFLDTQVKLNGNLRRLISNKKVCLKMIAALALLTVGTVVYSLVGGIIKGDLAWVFTGNPYKHIKNYGQGNWTHFPRNFVFITGVPIYGLWILGILLGGVAIFWKKGSLNSHVSWRLIYGLFSVYFGAHVVFWATGTAHSMGLMRVMVSLTPLAALIAARALFFLLSWFPKGIYQNIFLTLVCAYVAAFPFLPNPASLKVRDFQLSPDQVMLDQNADLVDGLEANDLKVYYAHPYVPIAFGFDPFLYPRHMSKLSQSNIPPGTMFVWDNWFSVVEAGVPELFWEENPKRFLLRREVRANNSEGKEIKIKFYVSL